MVKTERKAVFLRKNGEKGDFSLKKSQKNVFFKEKNLIKPFLRGILYNLQQWGRDFCTPVRCAKCG